MMRRFLLAMLVLAPWCAQAGFKVVEAPKGPPHAANAEQGRDGYVPLDGGVGDGDAHPSSPDFGLAAVTYTGTPPAEVEVRRGLGHDVRLADALKQISPSGWRGFGRPEVSETFDAGKPVDWAGGRPWTQVLDALAKREGLSVEVDWNRKHLYVGKLSPATTGTPRAIAGVMPPTSRAVIQQPLAERPDVLRAGTPLSEALKGYVERRGWQLRWLIDADYVLDVDLPIPSMEMIDGVTWVVRAYQAQGGMQGVVPRFAKGNNVVVIEQMDVREETR